MEDCKKSTESLKEYTSSVITFKLKEATTFSKTIQQKLKELDEQRSSSMDQLKTVKREFKNNEALAKKISKVNMYLKSAQRQLNEYREAANKLEEVRENLNQEINQHQDVPLIEYAKKGRTIILHVQEWQALLDRLTKLK